MQWKKSRNKRIPFKWFKKKKLQVYIQKVDEFLWIIYDEKLENIDEEKHYRYDDELDT